jgi:PAS domain S-box-containing protein
MVRDGLVAAGREDLLDTAELLVSEIVTNALVHAGTAIEVAFSFADGGLLVEVTDGSPHVPTLRAYGPSAGTGRGLMLLEEMVDEWGVVQGDPGKTVWFRIASGGDSAEPAAARSTTARVEAETLDVELLDVPLLLHEAWRQHAESLLREYLLASLDVLDAAEEAIAVHADASDAIALLAEHIPQSGAGGDPRQVMVTATEPRVSSPRVMVPVPLRSVSHFATLERAILTALELVQDGVFLTPRVQPELQGLRAWLCDQVISQSSGHPPEPWVPGQEPEPRLDALAWDDGPVKQAARGVLAADDEDRIVAVSESALEILGYADRADLLGSRLTVIIPERYRQAHLAGFTMHFLSGRALLIGRTVVVPALRGDGSEVDVELTIRTERTEDGRTVFVADLAGAAS